MSFSRTEEISPVVGDSKGDRKALETLDLNKVCKVFVVVEEFSPLPIKSEGIMIQHYVIKFVNDLQQVCGSRRLS